MRLRQLVSWWRFKHGASRIQSRSLQSPVHIFPSLLPLCHAFMTCSVVNFLMLSLQNLLLISITCILRPWKEISYSSRYVQCVSLQRTPSYLPPLVYSFCSHACWQPSLATKPVDICQRGLEGNTVLGTECEVSTAIIPIFHGAPFCCLSRAIRDDSVGRAPTVVSPSFCIRSQKRRTYITIWTKLGTRKKIFP